MALISPALAASIAQRHGVVPVEALVADSTTLNTIERLVRNGTLVRTHHGVLRVATSPDTFESRCVAAWARDDELVISGVAAARLWAFRHVWVTDTPIGLVAHDRTPIRNGVVLRRTNRLDDTDVVLRPDGIRVASPPRAWFGCARDLDDESSNDSPSGCWTITRRCPRCGASPVGWPHGGAPASVASTA